MAMFTRMKFETLDDLFTEQIQDLYDAEKRLVEALPKMADASSEPSLKEAFLHHLAETRQHVGRLDQIFELLGKELNRETCEAMKGLVEEGDEVIDAKGDDRVIDAALIAAAQRVEHYEIAGYGTARSLAENLGYDQAASLLQETLDEEGNADKRLTELSTRINMQAQHATKA